ncbi:MAG: DotA/TraY family protein [Alphaproteobacteria bacterium]
MPGIIPQVKELTQGGFGYLALLIAVVYQAVRILPANHPYTRYENLGKFGIRQVIGAAANNVKFNKRNIDQIIVFFAILAGLVILLLQLLAFVGILISGQAWAQPAATFTGLFSTPNPQTDIAFFMLREVFGIPGMFGTLTGGQTSLHIALQSLIQFYNLAILVVAIVVFVYYVIVVVAETAQTGTPFGQRFSHIYAPIRLVMAIGLLVPLNYGFNSAQYITLYAAKAGSGFATTGWSEFNVSLSASNPLGVDNAVLIAETKPPDIEGLVTFMAMVVTCREAMDLNFDPIISGAPQRIRAYVMTNNQPVTSIGTGPTGGPAAAAYQTQVNNITNNIGTEDVRVVFGAPATTPGQYENDIFPYCGSLIIPVNVPGANANSFGGLQAEYFRQVLLLWNNTTLMQLGRGFAVEHSGTLDCASTPSAICSPQSIIKNGPTGIVSNTRNSFATVIQLHFQQARQNINFQILQQTLLRGWGGAGIWYNRIAEQNGAYVVTVMNIPSPQKYPQVMEKVLEENKKANNKFKSCEAYEPKLADQTAIQFDNGLDEYYAGVYNDAYQYWACDKTRATGNFFLDAASAIFGLNGLMSIRQTTVDSSGNTVEVHPLAKLSALGKGLIESAIRNMGFAIGFSVVGGLTEIIGQQLAGAATAASSMFVSIATIGLSIGFITYYILPFLPFIYFFFAVGSWVKSIFEAMVGTPLWALAHLRIDGDGLPGKMAMNGYLLILEIFLRPILTVFGLLGGLAIFSAMATILNEIFDLVVINTAGVDLQAVSDSQFSRHIVDVFFFTVVYAVLLYMMAVSSFKMINLVPNNILRWLGQSVASFSDNDKDPAQGLTQYAAIGGARIGGQLAGGLTKAGQGLGGLVDGVGKIAKG